MITIISRMPNAARQQQRMFTVLVSKGDYYMSISNKVAGAEDID